MTQPPAPIEGVPQYRTGRELAALIGGPYSQCWYWRDELEAQQRTAREAVEQRSAQAAAGWKSRYEPTEEWMDNPDPDPKLRGVRGRVWRWMGAK